MKTGVILCCILLLLVPACSKNKTAVAVGPLRFNWGAPRHFEVLETISKNDSEMKIDHDCLFVSTNDGFVLEWHGAKIVEFDGQKPSEEFKQAFKPIESSFNYPSFRISENGGFIEVIDPEETVQKANQMLDQVFTNRPADNRKFYSELGKSKSGQQMVNQVFARIWQTWVETWLDLNLADGESICETNQAPFIGGAIVPVISRTSNLGSVADDPAEVALKYEEDLFATNYSGAMNYLIHDVAKNTEIKSAGPLTNNASMRRLSTLEVQTDPQTLRPRWAESTARTMMFIDGDETNMLESHEYQFNWDSKEPLQSR